LIGIYDERLLGISGVSHSFLRGLLGKEKHFNKFLVRISLAKYSTLLDLYANSKTNYRDSIILSPLPTTSFCVFIVNLPHQYHGPYTDHGFDHVLLSQ
jgi:hypothetical protein